jgi:hypothetical protein
MDVNGYWGQTDGTSLIHEQQKRLAENYKPFI